jgi:hypothetical protein
LLHEPKNTCAEGGSVEVENLEALEKADENYHVDQMKMKHFGIGIFISESENENKNRLSRHTSRSCNSRRA